ncbi:hypothetical protein MKX03_031132, partial [Papaver bracteatum]
SPGTPEGFATARTQPIDYKKAFCPISEGQIRIFEAYCSRLPTDSASCEWTVEVNKTQNGTYHEEGWEIFVRENGFRNRSSPEGSHVFQFFLSFKFGMSGFGKAKRESYQGMGSGIKTMKKGECNVHHPCRQYEGHLQRRRSRQKGLEFVVGDGYFCPALRKAVRTMKKKEKVLLTVKPQYADGFVEKGRPVSGREVAVPPNADEVIGGLGRAVMTMKKFEVAPETMELNYAFGSSESQQEFAVVPPGSTVSYKVELVSFVKDKESWDSGQWREGCGCWQ